MNTPKDFVDVINETTEENLEQILNIAALYGFGPNYDLPNKEIVKKLKKAAQIATNETNEIGHQKQCKCGFCS